MYTNAYLHEINNCCLKCNSVKCTLLMSRYHINCASTLEIHLIYKR